MIEQIAMTNGFGVELKGLDLSTLGEPQKLIFQSAFDEHQLVLIRDVEISEGQGVALTELLGRVSFASPFMKAGSDRKSFLISNQHEDGALRDGELLFHSDFSFSSSPLKAISLYSLLVPENGGETVFVDAAAAYRRLPDELKNRIKNLHARHVANYNGFRGDERPTYDPSSGTVQYVHPIVWHHPRTGTPILYVSRLITESIIGLPRDEGEELLQQLFAHIEDAAYQYVHKWRPFDFLVWDNRQLQHSRRPFDPASKRALRRVPIAGELSV